MTEKLYHAVRFDFGMGDRMVVGPFCSLDSAHAWAANTQENPSFALVPLAWIDTLPDGDTVDAWAGLTYDTEGECWR